MRGRHNGDGGSDGLDDGSSHPEGRTWSSNGRGHGTFGRGADQGNGGAIQFPERLRLLHEGDGPLSMNLQKGSKWGPP